MRLDRRLHELFPGASGRAIKHWLEGGRVRVTGHVVRRGDVAVGSADRVELGPPPGPSFPTLLRLVFEDAAILVIDKPPGLLTIATERERDRTAYRLLADYVGGHRASADKAKARRRGPRLFIVHRLDRETSGLIVFAKSSDAKRRLRSRLRENRTLRVRHTRNRSAGREAITDYRVLEHGNGTTLLELSLVTGRRGQIRAQLATLGHPIVGDHAYGARHDPLRRLCLHATRLAFSHPHGHRVAFESPAPPGFTRIARVGGA